MQCETCLGAAATIKYYLTVLDYGLKAIIMHQTTPEQIREKIRAKLKTIATCNCKVKDIRICDIQGGVFIMMNQTIQELTINKLSKACAAVSV